MPEICSGAWPGSANARYVISWCCARWRMRCHVRSLPPLSSGSSRSDFNQRMRIGEYLYPFVVDECPMPELQIQEAPDAIAAVSPAGGVIPQEGVDCLGIDDPALARAAVEEHVARDCVPSASGPP